MDSVSRVLLVAWITFRAALGGLRGLALALLAAIPLLIVAAIALSGAGSTAAMDAAQSLFFTLDIRVVVVLCVLVVSVALFRSEIESDTLTYLTTRSIPRPAIVVGKYVGGIAATLLITVPAGLLPLGTAVLAGASAPAAAIPGTVLAVTLLACLAYGGFFLLLGLVSRSALVLGLVYGFIWEELVLMLPGQFPKLTVLYYLLSIGSRQVSAGPLAGFPTVVSPAVAFLVPIGVAVVWVVLTAVIVRFVETAPQRVSA